MPYNFKNNGVDVYPNKFKKIMYIFAIIGFGFLPFHLILFRTIYVQDILDIIGGLVLIWMARFGGGYKIARWWASRQLKKKDNKWKFDK